MVDQADDRGVLATFFGLMSYSYNQVFIPSHIDPMAAY